jgi:uncharacterized protein (TIGR02145 family)
MRTTKICILFILVFIGCTKEKSKPIDKSISFNKDHTYGSVCDIDGNTYKTIKIGSQTWMAENLRTSRYQNGDIIPNIKEVKDWAKTNQGAYCYMNEWFYEIDSTSKKIYGALYNWYAVSDLRNIAPVGWHVSTDEDWQKMESYLGLPDSELLYEYGARGESSNIGSKLKESGTIHWPSPNSDATNESGFTALPSSARDSSGIGLGHDAAFWTTSLNYFKVPYIRSLFRNDRGIVRGYENKSNGLSVRCVKN